MRYYVKAVKLNTYGRRKWWRLRYTARNILWYLVAVPVLALWAKVRGIR